MNSPARSTVLLTGAAGRVATALRPLLRSRRAVRLTDVRELGSPLEPGEEYTRGDLADARFAAEVTDGVSAIVHLAGETSVTAGWASLLANNVAGLTSLLDAAQERGVRRIVYASSVHAAGGYNDPADWPVAPSLPPRPCCRYGASKAAGEVVARLYSDDVIDAHVVCLRLALVTYPVRWREEARSWLADEDLCRLVDAALGTAVGYGIYFGVSDCERPRFDLGSAEHDLGYVPRVRPPADGLPTQRFAYAANCRLWRK